MSSLRGWSGHRATLPFLNLRISEVQETSDWRAHGWNVVSEQRKSNWQHPNTYYRKGEKTPGNDECDTSHHPHPYGTLPTKAVQIMPDPSRDVSLEAVHFLLEIRNSGHARLSGMLWDLFLSSSAENLPAARAALRLPIQLVRDGPWFICADGIRPFVSTARNLLTALFEHVVHCAFERAAAIRCDFNMKDWPVIC